MLVHAAEDTGHLQAFLVWLEGAHPVQLMAVLVIAPIFAVPLAGLLVVVGLALPFPVGLGLTMVALAIHHGFLFALSHTRASRWLRRQLVQRRMLPEQRGEQSLADDFLFVFTATWVPGLSYVFKLAVVLLAGVPARRFFIMSPICQLTSAVPYLLLGEVAQEVASGGWR